MSLWFTMHQLHQLLQNATFCNILPHLNMFEYIWIYLNTWYIIWPIHNIPYLYCILLPMLPILTEADTQHRSKLQSGSRHAARLPAAEFAAFGATSSNTPHSKEWRLSWYSLVTWLQWSGSCSMFCLSMVSIKVFCQQPPIKRNTNKKWLGPWFLNFELLLCKQNPRSQQSARMRPLQLMTLFPELLYTYHCVCVSLLQQGKPNLRVCCKAPGMNNYFLSIWSTLIDRVCVGP